MADVPITLILLAWIGFVLFVASKWLYGFVIRRGWEPHRGTYLGRKFVHIFGAGVVAVLLPFEFHEPYFPFLFAMMLAGLTFTLHKTNHVLYWFQDPANYSETYFALTWGAAVLLTWFVDSSFLLAVVPTLFMAWGDGVTGLVRSQVYHNGPTKGWWGSLAMLDVSLAISLAFVRPFWVGVVGSVVATIVEHFFGDNGVVKWADDNLAIPLLSMGVMLGLMALTGNL